MTRIAIALFAVLAALPLIGLPDYFLHLGIATMLAGLTFTGWALMGRRAWSPSVMAPSSASRPIPWRCCGTMPGCHPGIGLPAGVALGMAAAALLAYPCFRLRVVGHYFALVTLAAGEIVRILIVALRDHTGGSLGMTPRLSPDNAFAAMQFSKHGFWWIAVMAWPSASWCGGGSTAACPPARSPRSARMRMRRPPSASA